MGCDKERVARQAGNIYVPPKGGGIRTIPIREDIRDSPAYQLLPATARLILFDMIGAHCRATRWEKSPAPFSYSWRMSGEPCSESAFTDARRAVVAAGFFETRGADQTNEPGGPIHYRASAAWQTFKPSSEQAAEIQRRDAAKGKRIAHQHKRRKRFREGIKTYHEKHGSTGEPSP